MTTIHFEQEEFACECGCGFDTLNPQLEYKLELARVTAKIPFVINSACRCEKHNKAEGGLSNSAHLEGKAVDIVAIDPHRRYLIVRGLIMAGIKRIIIYPDKGFIHADIDENKPQEILSVYF
jgi:uncharacterized protein YcbK (DUF882 family)